MARRLHDALSAEPTEVNVVPDAAHLAGGAAGKRLRQQIVPACGLASSANAGKAAVSPAPGSTQVGLKVEHETLDESVDGMFGESGCGLRVKGILRDASVGRYEKVDIGTLVYIHGAS